MGTLIGKEEKLKIYQLHVKKVNTVNTGQSVKPCQGYHPAEHCKTKKNSQPLGHVHHIHAT